MLFALYLFSIALACMKLAGVVTMSWWTVAIPLVIALVGQAILAVVMWVYLTKFDVWRLW